MALREKNSALHWAATRPEDNTPAVAVAVGHFVQVPHLGSCPAPQTPQARQSTSGLAFGSPPTSHPRPASPRLAACPSAPRRRYPIRCGATMPMNSRDVITFVFFQNLGKCLWLPVTS